MTKNFISNAFKFLQDDKYRCIPCKISLHKNNINEHSKGRKHNTKLIEWKASKNKKAQPKKRIEKRNVKTAKILQLANTDPKNFNNQQFQFGLDKLLKIMKEPLVGIKYSVEVKKPSSKDSLYICVLCNEKCINTIAYQDHMVTENHRMNYLQRHFTSITDRLERSQRFNEDLQFRDDVLAKICSVIDSKFSRPSPYIYGGNDFEGMELNVYEYIENRHHISFQDIPDATKFLLRKIDLSDGILDHYSDTEGTRKRKLYMCEYESAVFSATEALKRQLLDYERYPDSHPRYQHEWKIFYEKKFQEATSRGEDINRLDLDSEWFDYFLRRIRVIHEMEVKRKIEEIRILDKY